MQARGLLIYRLKYGWMKVICCICQSNKIERETTTVGAQNGGHLVRP